MTRSNLTTDLHQKLAQLNQMPSYLAELSLLLGRVVSPIELSPSSEAINLSNRTSELLREPVVKQTLPFAEKTTPAFNEFINTLTSAYSGPIALFTPRTTACGFITVASLSDIHWNFPFTLNSEGIFSIVTLELTDRIVMDFFLGEGGSEMLELEVQGKNWSRILYQSS